MPLIKTVQIDTMLDIDEELFNMFSFEFMKKNKVIPVSIDKTGTQITFKVR